VNVRGGKRRTDDNHIRREAGGAEGTIWVIVDLQAKEATHDSGVRTVR
jgi:hypothetical protein